MFSKLRALFGPADLWAAAKSGDVAAIRRLVAEGDDVNRKDSEGKTPLHFAARRQRVEAIRVLVELGADVNTKDSERRSPLAEAASEGVGANTIDALVELGAKIDSQDSIGGTALSWAVFYKHESTVVALLKRGANPNAAKGKKLSQTLTRAVEARNWKIFELLLEAGAKPELPGDVVRRSLLRRFTG